MQAKAASAFCAAVVLLGAARPAPAQSSWASEGPVVHGHHHLNVTDRAAHERFWGDTLGGLPTPWRDVRIFKFPDALVFLTERAPTGGTTATAEATLRPPGNDRYQNLYWARRTLNDKQLQVRIVSD